MDKRIIFSGSRARAGQAFTLIELLVSTAVFCLMVVVLVAMVSQAGNIWRRGESQNQRRSAGRVLLQNISRELQQAALPVDLPFNSGTNAPANLQFIANVSANPSNGTVIPTAYLNPHAIFWQAPIAQNSSQGDLASVGYFVKWDTASTPVKAQLCRYYAQPASTGSYQIYQQSGGSPANWLANIATVAPASSTNLQGWFADDVIAFWVRCLDKNGQPIKQTASGQVLNSGFGFDSRQGFKDSAGNIHLGPALPAAVEIAMVTLDHATAGRLTSAIQVTPVSPDTFHADIAAFVSNLAPNIKTGVQVFSTTVFLQGYQP